MYLITLALLAFAVVLGWQNRSRLNELQARVAALEASPPEPKAKAAPKPEARPAPPPPPPAPEPVKAAARKTPDAPKITAPPLAPKPSLEERLGARWTVWVGGLSLALGGVFLARYSIEAGLLGPGARIALGALFAALLIGAGEWFRRRQGAIAFGIPSAHIPSVLTAAGTVAAFATIFSAHALYGFIGPGVTFVLLAVIAIACLLAAALHGPALAGLGLIGAAVTPLLVSSDEPNAWALFMHIAVVTATALALARLRDWKWLAITAGIMALGWGLFYTLSAGSSADEGAVTVFVFVLSLLLIAYHAAGDDNGKIDVATCTLLGGFGAIALLLLTINHQQSGLVAAFTALIVLFLGAAWRFPRLTPLLATSLSMSTLAVLFWNLAPQLLQDPTSVFPGPGDAEPLSSRMSLYLLICALHGALFLAAGTGAAFQALDRSARVALAWAGLAASGPLLLLASAYWRAVEFVPEVRYAATAAALAIVYVALTSRFIRREATEPASAGPTGAFAAGAASALALGLAMVLREGYLTISLALLAAGLAWVYSIRPIPTLRVLALIAGVIVIVCTGLNPLIIEEPGTTPVFNALLWGYGLPAIAFAAAAVLFRRAGALRESGVFEALALVYTALLFFFEIRHWAQGGDLLAASVSLYETGLQAVVAFLLAVATNRLNVRSPSPVLGMAVPLMGALGIAIAMLGLLVTNPMITGEEIGDGPFLTPLFLGYLAPAAAAAVYALQLRGRPPEWQAPLGALAALILTLAYATLEVRSAFHAPDLQTGPTTDFELYTYSVVWLVLGIVLLIAGGLLRSRVLRLGSAAVLVLVVLKVFLFDMNDLTGILRALSFMGLGLVLVGIGAIYQRLLFPRAKTA